MNRIKTKLKNRLYLVLVLMVVLIAAALASPMASYAAGNPLKLTIGQVFTTTSASVNDTFTYRLKPLVPSPMPQGSDSSGYSFAIKGTGSADVGPINYVRQGRYRYELSQVIGTENPRFTYDKRVYIIDVYVDDSLDVSLIINVDGSKTDSIIFENGYSALPSLPVLMADPPVRKTVSGNPGQAGTFTFALEASVSTQPMPPGSVNGVKTISITGSGQGEFGVWSYDRAGTYYYTVYEVKGTAAGYTYDTTVYTITDIVRDDGGQLVLSRTVTNSAGAAVSSMAFINKYSPEEGKPGKPGPLTGDEVKTALFYSLFALGGAAAVGAVIYLAAGKRRKRTSQGNAD